MSESQKGKHSAPRKKRQSDTQKDTPLTTKIRSETPQKYGMSTSKLGNEIQTNSPPEIIQIPQLQPTQLPVFSFKHTRVGKKDPFYVGFSTDPNDLSGMSESWHSVADISEWTSEIMDEDCTEKEIRDLSKFYLELYKPSVNILEAKLSLLSAHELRLLELPEEGGEYSVPYGVDEDEVPTNSYINDRGYLVEPPGAEQTVNEDVKTGTHVGRDGTEYDTWVDTTPQNQQAKKKADPVVDVEKQLKLMREIVKRAMETKEEIDDNADYSEREINIV